MADFIDNILRSGEPLLFHNAPFDIAVLKEAFPLSPWNLLTKERVHDTMFQLFLADPYAPTLSLKPSAERYLEMAPEERNELTAWILSNVPEATRKTAGAFISRAPVELIAPYAIGDVTRTLGLYEHLKDRVPQEAYDRERFLMPILMESSQRGIRVNRAALEQCLGRSMAALKAADDRVRATLQAPGLAVSVPSELSQALQRAGKLNKITLTPTGKVSTNKKVLTANVNDPDLLRLLTYRSSLETCIGTFMTSWLELSKKTGRLHPEWNQVRNTETGKRFGTRTGRLSCSNPNLQNVPTQFLQDIPEGLPPLPYMREFLLPEEGHVWLKRDFSGQELRIAAHFEDGPLLAAYKENPNLDPHQLTKERIFEMLGKDFERKHVKITGFQIIYGGGAPAISLGIGCTLEEGIEFKHAYFTAMPGIRRLSQDVTNRGRSGQVIKTWGGREYHAERVAEKDFSYKLLNYLIQGSAADQTKQSIIDWKETAIDGSIFLATVHDENNISAPIDDWERHMTHLQEVMDRDRFDCPMRSEGFVGPNWHELEACK